MARGSEHAAEKERSRGQAAMGQQAGQTAAGQRGNHWGEEHGEHTAAVTPHRPFYSHSVLHTANSDTHRSWCTTLWCDLERVYGILIQMPSLRVRVRWKNAFSINREDVCLLSKIKKINLLKKEKIADVSQCLKSNSSEKTKKHPGVIIYPHHTSINSKQLQFRYLVTSNNFPCFFIIFSWLFAMFSV